MAINPKIVIGFIFILLVLVGLTLPDDNSDSNPVTKKDTSESGMLKQALFEEGLIVRELIVADSTEVEEAFGINLNEGKAVIVIFESKYSSLSDGAAREYAIAIIKTFEKGEDIDYGFALANNIIGGLSKKPVLGWADRSLVEEIKEKDLIAAYNNLNLEILEFEAVPYGY